MKIIARLFLLLIFFAWYTVCSGQQRPADIDTLMQKLSVAKDDTSKAMALLHIGDAFDKVNTDSAFSYLSHGLALSKKNNFDRGIFEYYCDYSNLMNTVGKPQKSLEANLECLPYAQKINSPYPGYGMLAWHGNISVAYYGLAIYDSCIAHCLAAIKIIESNNDMERAAIMYSNLASIYTTMKQYAKACEYGKKAIGISSQLKLVGNLENALINTGGIYAAIRRYDSAMYFLTQAKSLCIEHKDDYALATTLVTINYVLTATNHFGDVKKNAEKILEIAKVVGDEGGRASAIFSMARYDLNMKNYDAARDSAKAALKIGLAMGQPEGCMEAYLLLSDIELAAGNMQDYHRYRDQSDSVRELILSAETEKNAQEFEAKYSLNKKQAEIENLTKTKKIQTLEIKQRNIVNWILAIGILVIFITSFLFYRNYTQKKKLLLREKELQQQQIVQLEKEKQLTATQAVLQGQDEERTRLAKDLHDGLGGMLSGIKFSFSNMKENLIMTPDNQQAFERSMDMLDSSIKELRRVAHNMMPESLIKFGLDAALGDMCNYISQSGAVKTNYQSVGLKDVSIDKNIAVNIYRIIQELLNNSLKHAAATEIIVQTALQDNHFTITVEDNGKGFDTNLISQNAGMGWVSIQNRVAYLKGKMDVQSSGDKGTSVHIEFNIDEA